VATAKKPQKHSPKSEEQPLLPLHTNPAGFEANTIFETQNGRIRAAEKDAKQNQQSH